MPTSLKALGPALRLLRGRRQLKQTEVADKSGLTKAMLSSYETGKATPSLASLDAILGALETDFIEFQDALRAASGETAERGSAPPLLGDARGAAWSELREDLVRHLRELQVPLERIAAAIERLSGPVETGVSGDGGMSPTEQHRALIEAFGTEA